MRVRRCLAFLVSACILVCNSGITEAAVEAAKPHGPRPETKVATSLGEEGGPPTRSPVGQPEGKNWQTPVQRVGHGTAPPAPIPDSPSDAVTAPKIEGEICTPPPSRGIQPELPPVRGEKAEPLPEMPEQSTPPKRVRELENLRTSHSRQFLSDDGSITAEVFSGAIHYKDEDGEWQPIDLAPREVETTETVAGSVYETVQGDVYRTVKKGVYRVDRAPFILDLPPRLSQGLSIESREGHGALLWPVGARNVAAHVYGVEARYEEAWENVDLIEKAIPEGLKERIVVKDVYAPDTYEFAMDLHGLEIEEGVGGALHLVDTVNGSVQFVMPASYVVDASGESAPVYTEVYRQEGKATLRLRLDKDWLKKPDREFPVTIDPSVMVACCRDAYGDPATPDMNYGLQGYIRVGRDSAITPAWIAWDLSSISVKATIRQVRASLYQNGAGGPPGSVRFAMAVLEDPWEESTVTYETQPNAYDYYSETSFDPSTAGQWRTWDITNLFGFWHRGVLPNYGVKVYALSTGATSFQAASREDPDPNLRPKLEITYTSGPHGLGLEPYWHFTGRDLGDGWSASVNTASHNLVLQKSLFAIAGRGPGIGDALTFNLEDDQGTMGLGVGWRLARNMKLVENTSGGHVDLTDEDGTTHRYLADGSGGYVTPPGVFRKLTKVDATTFTLQDKDQTVYRFDNGFLVSITDSNNNSTTVARDVYGRPTSQTDASGRDITYAYDAQGYLETITDPLGRTYTFGYDDSGLLISVLEPSGGAVTFEYDGNRLTSFTDARNNTTTFVLGAGRYITGIRDARSGGSTNYDTLFDWIIGGNVFNTRVTDPAGKWTDYEMDPATWNLKAQRNSYGDVVHNVWANNLLTKVTDANGTKTMKYDVNGNVIEVTETVGTESGVTKKWDTQAEWQEAGAIFQRAVVTQSGEIASDGTKSAAFSRSSTAYKVDGTQVSAGNARYEASDAGFGQGTMVEEGTSNLLSNPQFESGLAGWTKGDGGGTVESVTSERYFGDRSLHLVRTSDTGACYAIQDVTASEGTVYSLSAYVKRVAGSTATSLYLDFLDTNKNRLAVYWVNAPLGDWTRLKVEKKEAPANTRYIRVWLYLSVAVGSAGTEAYFDGVLLEAKKECTSFHDSTRSGETLTLPTAGVFKKGSWMVEMLFTPTADPVRPSDWRVIWQIQASTDNQYILWVHPSGRPYLQVFSGGTSKTTYNGSDPVLQAGVRYRLTVRGNGSHIAMFVNGVKSAAGDVAYVEPVGDLPANMYIGSAAAGNLQPNAIYDDVRISSRARRVMS